MTRDPSVRVLFIGGADRSGSTLLELLLDQIEGLTAVGEIRWIWDRAVSGKIRCGCGASFDECVFWRAVDEKFGGLEKDLASATRLRRNVLRIRRLPALLGWRSVPRRWSDELREYRDLLERLYGAVASTKPGEVIVDSSKHALYALALAGVPNVDVKILHLVRDPRAVMHSSSRTVERQGFADPTKTMPRYQPMRAAQIWALRNLLVHVAARRMSSCRRFRYEDVVDDPRGTLSRVGRELLSRSSVDTSFIVADEATIGEGHGLSGNRMRRYGEPIRIRSDDEWRQRRDARFLLAAALIAPMALRYGYWRARTT